jgi:hypothetical protein
MGLLRLPLFYELLKAMSKPYESSVCRVFSLTLRAYVSNYWQRQRYNMDTQ